MADLAALSGNWTAVARAPIVPRIEAVSAVFRELASLHGTLGGGWLKELVIPLPPPRMPAPAPDLTDGIQWTMRLRFRMPTPVYPHFIELPWCEEHDDCMATPALGRACWESRR